MAESLMPSVSSAGRADRIPPYSAEAEKGVLGSVLLDSARVLDLCIERTLAPESFYVPIHRTIFETLLDMWREGSVIDLLTVAERLDRTGRLAGVGGSAGLEQLVDSTPTAAHAEYYIEIVRQKHLLRSVISCAREAEHFCYAGEVNADTVLDSVEQAFMEITEGQHGKMLPWPDAVKKGIQHIEAVLASRKALRGISTGYLNLDRILQGLRRGEMIVLAARPGMGKTSLAMNIAEHVALGKGDPGRTAHPVGIFSLEMSCETLVIRMLCSHAGVSAFKLSGGYISATTDHGRLMQAASVLSKGPIFLDDTGGLDILELRARARRMKMKHDIKLMIVDYLQLLHSRETERQGKQVETAHISGNLKSMAKELDIPVLVLSQLSRAPEQREGRPRLSDLRDSGAIEQDADVVCLLRRPCKYPEDDENEDKTLAIIDVAKQRNGPSGEVRLNFLEEHTRFSDREHGVDGVPEAQDAQEAQEAEAAADMGGVA